ncbi:MAG: PAS domain-containing protein, partial [Dongiaceae bacterium]
MTPLSRDATAEAPRSSEVLRSERDRFVAFAFAMADAFFEIDPAHLVIHADGAVHWLTGQSADGLTGKAFVDLVVEEDRPLIRAALATGRDQGRFGPFDVRFPREGGRVIRTALSAAHIPGYGGSQFVAVRAVKPMLAENHEGDTVRDQETGLLDKEQFGNFANRALAASREAERPYNLTLLALDGLAGLRERVGVDGAADLMSEIAAYLSASSVGGASAGRLGDDKFGVIHEPTLDPKTLRSRISRRANSADPSGHGVRVAATTIELNVAETSEVDGAKAL